MNTVLGLSHSIAARRVLVVGLVALLTACPSQPATSLQIAPSTATLGLGSTVQLTAIVSDASGSPLVPQPSLSWLSSTPSVASVNADGLVSGLTAGQATVTVSMLDGAGGRIEQSASITVKQLTDTRPASLEVTPKTTTVRIGFTQNLVATVKNAAGEVLSAPKPSWASSDATRATVSADGAVTGIALGSVTITASVPTGAGGTVTGSSSLAVQPAIDPIPATLEITPGTLSLTLDASAPLTATLKNAAGEVLSTPKPSWASSNTTIASVDGSGVVTANALGDATITASVTGASGTVTKSVPVKVSMAGTSDAQIKGQWSSVASWPTLAIHASLMPDGSVVTFGWHGDSPTYSVPWTTVDRWNSSLAPNAGHTTTTYSGADMFGAGHDLLEDGRLLVAGGSQLATGVHPSPLWGGLAVNSLLNAQTNTWSGSALSPSSVGRWYPTVTTMPDGTVLVTGGLDADGSLTDLHEVINVKTNTRRSLTTAKRKIPYYGFVHVAPDGRAFMAGPEPQMAWLDTSGTGAWTDATKRNEVDNRVYGASVPFAEGKLLLVGGGPTGTTTDTVSEATDSVMIVDMNTGTSTPTDPMHYKRRNVNAVLLPDGRVLAVGGNRKHHQIDPVLETEVWDPTTGYWSLLSSLGQDRPYHSTALLLPDGRVFTGGGYDYADPYTTKYETAQFFSPPYLFKRDGSGQPAVRPSVSGVPTSLGYNQAFSVTTPDAASIAQVSLVRLGSTTHALDMGQRFLKLTSTPNGSSLQLSSPKNANIAPPGYYMLFLVNQKGTPSVAKIVRLAAP